MIGQSKMIEIDCLT